MLEYTFTYNTGSASDADHLHQLADDASLRKELQTTFGLPPGMHVAVSAEEVLHLHSLGVDVAEVCTLLTEEEIISLAALGIEPPAGAIPVMVLPQAA